jgi:predicted GNAT family acetyltransferase
MMELARTTKPGPFGPRTHELGAYIGIRRDGRLVGMAGERFRLQGHTEISAVAVDPSWRGQGFGRALTAALASAIRRAGKIPLLHVFADNTPALKLYESIGFTTRAELTIVWLAPE